MASSSAEILTWQAQDVWTAHVRWRLAHGSFSEDEWRHALLVVCDALDRATGALRDQEQAVIEALNAHAFPGVVYHEYDRVSCS
jgi:hypothetical protein